MKFEEFLKRNNDDKLIFDTFEETSEYLKTHFNGHGVIKNLETDKIIRTCKCSHKNPKQIIYIK